MEFSTLQKNNRQKGMALIMAIAFLAILSILGAVVMRVSLRGLEDSESRTYTQSDQQALYAADRAVEYSMNRDVIFNLQHIGEYEDLFSGFAKDSNHNSYGVTHSTVIDQSGPGELVAGKVQFLGGSEMPSAFPTGYDLSFGATMYHVNVETKAGTGLLQRSTHVDASIVRLFKLQDEQIFITTGGG